LALDLRSLHVVAATQEQKQSANATHPKPDAATVNRSEPPAASRSTTTAPCHKQPPTSTRQNEVQADQNKESSDQHNRGQRRCGVRRERTHLESAFALECVTRRGISNIDERWQSECGQLTISRSKYRKESDPTGQRQQEPRLARLAIRLALARVKPTRRRGLATCANRRQNRKQKNQRNSCEHNRL
jgi:hypothetical protein